MKNLLSAAVVVALLAAAVAFYAYRGGFGRGPAMDMNPLGSAPLAAPKSIPDGGDILAFEFEQVTGFEFNLPHRKLTAKKLHGSSARFSIEIVKDEPKTVEHCVGGRAFTQALAAFASIRGMRTLDPVATSHLFESHKSEVAEFQLLDATAIEPQPYRVLVLAGAPERVIVTDTLVFYDSMLPAEMVQRLQTGCSALGF